MTSRPMRATEALSWVEKHGNDPSATRDWGAASSVVLGAGDRELLLARQHETMPVLDPQWEPRKGKAAKGTRRHGARFDSRKRRISEPVGVNRGRQTPARKEKSLASPTGFEPVLPT